MRFAIQPLIRIQLEIEEYTVICVKGFYVEWVYKCFSMKKQMESKTEKTIFVWAYYR